MEDELRRIIEYRNAFLNRMRRIRELLLHSRRFRGPGRRGAIINPLERWRTNDPRNISRSTRYHFRNFLREIPQNSRPTYRNIYYNIIDRRRIRRRIRNTHHIHIIGYRGRSILYEDDQNDQNDNVRQEFFDMAQDIINNTDQAETFIGRIDNLADIVRIEHTDFVVHYLANYNEILSLLELIRFF